MKTEIINPGVAIGDRLFTLDTDKVRIRQIEVETISVIINRNRMHVYVYPKGEYKGIDIHKCFVTKTNLYQQLESEDNFNN